MLASSNISTLTGEQPQSESPIEIAAEEAAPARTVYLELEEIQEAKFFDVEVRPDKNTWAEPLKLRTSGAAMRFRLTPGKYNLRVRSVDTDSRPGEWGKWREFWVHFKPPKFVTPANGTVIDPKANQNELVTFEWPQVPSAKLYLFSLKTSEGKSLKRVITTKTWITQDVAVNSEYSWSVTPLKSQAQVEAPDLVPVWYTFKVNPPNENLRPILFQVDMLPEVEKYEFEFVKFIGENETGEPSRYESRVSDFRVRLGPGSYEMRVRTIYTDKTQGEWSAPEKFFVAIPPPTLDAPTVNKRIDPEGPSHLTRLKWRSIPEAESFTVSVYDQAKKPVFETVTKETELEVALPAGHSYTWSVAGYSRFETKRSPANVDSQNASSSTFKIDPYVKLDLASAEEPSQLYGWARQITSVAAYESRNWDTSTKTTQQILGGTSEAAFGYWHRKTSYGLLATGALSGFTVGTQNFFYAAGSILAGRRHLFEGGSRLRYWLGFGYREIPEILPNPANVIDFRSERIGSMGPETRVSYMQSINDTWGWHVFSNLYFGYEGVKSSNGEKPFNNYSFSAGGQVSHKYSESTSILFGYTYQLDEGRYPSLDIFGNPNVTRVAGHYLGFTLMMGLEKAKP